MRAGKETRAEMARELGLSVATVTNARKRMLRKVLEAERRGNGIGNSAEGMVQLAA